MEMVFEKMCHRGGALVMFSLPQHEAANAAQFLEKKGSTQNEVRTCKLKCKKGLQGVVNSV